ncbi:MAG: hypothetical protein SVU88_01725, partial [Candidatus Nanohaloarchaea archaeon]|nr:hypothetical protein [Candidatus Nanohaloarchaea archaeon]
MTALSPAGAFTRGFYDTITDGDYAPPEEQLISGVPVYRADEPGLVGATGDLADNAATGICAFTPSMTAGIQSGENPVTGASMDTYADVRRLMYRDLPELSQVADQFGCTGIDGAIAVVLEDEEWTARTCRMLDRAGIDTTPDQVQTDIRDLYGRLVDTFETYANDVLGNEAAVDPIYTSDATEAIDDRLWAAARQVGEPLPRDRSAVDDSERYRQRINMYFTPFWLDLVEQRLGL